MENKVQQPNKLPNKINLLNDRRGGFPLGEVIVLCSSPNTGKSCVYSTTENTK